jgi:hypothetical protein
MPAPSSAKSLLWTTFSIILLATVSPGEASAQTVASAAQCTPFVDKFLAAQARVKFEGRFARPDFRLDASRSLNGLPVFIALIDDKDEMRIACEANGRLASLSVEGNSAEDADFNRMSAIAVSVISALSDDISKTAAGDLYFKLYQTAEARLRSVPNTAGKGITATDKWNEMAIRMTHYPSRAMRFEVARSVDLLMNDPAAVQPRKPAAQSEREWRCDASDPDGRTGMADVSDKGGNVMPPVPEKGACVVRAQPHDLYRSPGRLLGRTIEVKDMGCYRHDRGDYRCIPFQAHLKSAEHNRVIVMAPKIAGEGLQDLIDENCPTMRRGLESRNCRFKISFDLLEYGTDHTETVRSIKSDAIQLTP